jgi:hypothetical protein
MKEDVARFFASVLVASSCLRGAMRWLCSPFSPDIIEAHSGQQIKWYNPLERSLRQANELAVVVFAMLILPTADY